MQFRRGSGVDFSPGVCRTRVERWQDRRPQNRSDVGNASLQQPQIQNSLRFDGEEMGPLFRLGFRGQRRPYTAGSPEAVGHSLVQFGGKMRNAYFWRRWEFMVLSRLRWIDVRRRDDSKPRV